LRAAFGLHFDRSIIREQRWSGPHQLANVGGQRFHQSCRLPDPARQRGAMQIDLFAGIDLGLAI